MMRYYEKRRSAGAENSSTPTAGSDTRRKILALLQEAAAERKSSPFHPASKKLDLVHVDDAADAFLLAAISFEGSHRHRGEFAVSAGKALTLGNRRARGRAAR